MTYRISLLLLLTLIATAAQAQTSQPSEGPPATTVDASDGVTISSGVNSLTIGARVQFRWTVEDREAFDADRTGSGLGRGDDAVSSFDIPRLRVSLSGGALRPWLRYALQFDFGRTSGESASKIKDATLEIRPVGRSYRFTMGQFKVPFGLQQLTSSGRLQFVDRALTDGKFAPGRDMGVMAGATMLGRRLGVEGGVFNGAGESVRENNAAPLWAARVYVDPLGPYTLSETGVDAGERPVLHLGAAVRAGDAIRGRGTPGVFEEPDRQRAVNVEVAFKSRRLYSTAEHFWMTDDPQTGVSRDSRGYHAQAGVMVVPRRADVSVRYAQVDGDAGLASSDVSELRAAAGYFWQAHNLKLQADVGRVRYDARYGELAPLARQGLPALGSRLAAGRELSDVELRVQLQLAF